MLKRFYSKKSGFTLVEIIIAFAVFAIMASMICQILQLSVAARNKNNQYQIEFARSQAAMTVINKHSGDFKNEEGKMKLNFADGTNLELAYDVWSGKEDVSSDDVGLNYFVMPVNYGASGEVPPTVDGGSGSSNTSGSQASRMDTRLTGTAGIGFIRINKIVKDTNTYPADSPYAIPAGHTRYFIQCSASSKPSGSTETSLKDEDVPYSQYRLAFYDANQLDAAASAVIYTDDNGKKYTKDVYQRAQIAKVGYLNDQVSDSLVLSDSKVAVGTTTNYNKYTVDQMGTNTVRIGSPFIAGGDDGGYGGKGVRFNLSNFSNFYVEFVGDPQITTESFGYNGVSKDSGACDYAACPMYTDDYNTDGTPTYDYEDKNHVNIYGANLYVRHYS